MTSCSNAGAVESSKATPITAQEAQLFYGRAGVEFVDPRPISLIMSTTGKIGNARTISLNDVEAGILPPAFADRSLRVITTCTSGPMAERAAAAFADMGFAQVNWIDGGTEAWIEAGFETVR